jgi:uncharacterized protein YggE
VLVVAVVVALVLGGLALGIAAGTSGATATHPAVSCGPTTPKLTVHGTGQATATPDLLTVVVQVSITEPTAATALAADDAKAAAVVAAFQGGGAEAKDIQTAGLSLQPQYSYPRGIPAVTGYQVINAVTATLRDLAQSGAVIDAVVAAGGNAVQIESLAFSTLHPSAVEAQARARATTQAVAYARALARAAGRSLGPVCSLNDQSEVPPSENTIAGSAFASAAAVPIEAGSQTQTAQVALVYALVPPARARR